MRLGLQIRRIKLRFRRSNLFTGIAYCLEVLGQWDQFDSLHWMESVMFHLTAQRKAVASQSKAETEENLQVCNNEFFYNNTLLFAQEMSLHFREINYFMNECV